MAAKDAVQELLAKAGITVNGDEPYDIQVHNDAFYKRALAEGSIGVGESYMDGWWSCDELDEFLTRVFNADLKDEVKSLKLLFHVSKAWLFNQQRQGKTADNAQHHYDKGNDLYEAMLDEYMQYTCAYYKDADTLEQAQQDKLALICEKIGLEDGMTVLDIGCGWGGLAKYMAEEYGASVTGYNVSEEQVKWARNNCEGLSCEFVLEDYRNATGEYDRVVSIGMLEHVGYKNYREFMEVSERCLTDDGLALFHTIGGNESKKTTDPWLDKHIFPGSMLPSIAQLADAMEGLFVVEDWHNFGAYYDPTLMAWHENFTDAWDELKNEYDERFYRMWEFYLLSCAALFRSRTTQLWQVVATKDGVAGGYDRVT